MREVTTECKIDWVKSFSYIPTKAAISDKDGKFLRDVSYYTGIAIEEMFKKPLDELEVVKVVREFDSGDSECCYIVSDGNDENAYTIKD